MIPYAIASAWYGGVFAIFTFAFQMVIMLVAGYVWQLPPQVHEGTRQAGFLGLNSGKSHLSHIFVALVASWLNWGLGLVHRRAARTRDCQARSHRFWMACCRSL